MFMGIYIVCYWYDYYHVYRVIPATTTTTYLSSNTLLVFDYLEGLEGLYDIDLQCNVYLYRL